MTPSVVGRVNRLLSREDGCSVRSFLCWLELCVQNDGVRGQLVRMGYFVKVARGLGEGMNDGTERTEEERKKELGGRKADDEEVEVEKAWQRLLGVLLEKGKGEPGVAEEVVAARKAWVARRATKV